MDKTTATLVYDGQLRTTAVHTRSTTSLITDAPTDNNGKGEAFSPTDLVATALASCMLTIMGILANRKGWDMDGAKANILKTMASDPRRIAQIDVQIIMPAKGYSEEAKKMLVHAAETCPVALSLNEDLKQVLSFEWL